MKEALGVDGLDALLIAGRELLDLSPSAFAQVLAAARAFVVAYARPDESDAVFASRLAQIDPRGPRVFD